jgi:hypothetical protein
MAGLSNTTRAHVLDTLSTFDAMGGTAFLAAHSYGRSTRWVLRYNGRSYPSKAIAGVAAGLSSSEFFGGVAQVVPFLRGLGFTVVDAQQVKVDPEMLELANLAGAGLAAPRTELAQAPACYFASGSNRPAEIRGLAGVSADIGVAVDELSRNAIDALKALAGSDVQVFVDSGAFSEVEFGPAGPSIVKPINHAEWTRRLAIYLELAEALGSQVWIVAPDLVGSQAVTLERLERYRAEVVAIAATGARVLVAMQKGDDTQAEFAAQVDVVLEGVDWHPALPCMKAATTAVEAAAFLDARRPAHVHLLGLGPRNNQAPKFVAAIAAVGASYTLDSNWLTGNTGWFNGPKGGPRRFTLATARARFALLAGALTADQVKPFALLLTLGAFLLGAQ